MARSCTRRSWPSQGCPELGAVYAARAIHEWLSTDIVLDATRRGIEAGSLLPFAFEYSLTPLLAVPPLTKHSHHRKLNTFGAQSLPECGLARLLK